MTDRLRADPLSPSPRRLDPRHPRRPEILARHADAVARGLPVYADPSTGFSVFTATFLAARGDCCSSGCRHCPYDDDPPFGDAGPDG